MRFSLIIHMEEQIVKEIKQQIFEIEQKEQVKIIFAVESGSRAWGFASPDSDYDVRFIYARKPTDYLKLEGTRDVIEWKLDDIYDINGWDLKKALILMHGSNPTLFEWCTSPIIYVSTPEMCQFQKLAKEYFSPIKAFNHYLHTAKNTYWKHIKRDDVRLKKYLYVLRPLLCASWIQTYKLQPPMLFDGLVETMMEPYIVPEVQKLLDMKQKTVEAEKVEQNKLLNEYIEQKLEHLESVTGTMPKKEVGWEPLNKYFLECLEMNPVECYR